MWFEDFQPPMQTDSWSDAARFEADRWRDGWSSFPLHAGALANQSAFDSVEWASIEPSASDLQPMPIPASLSGDGSAFAMKTTVRLMTEEPQVPKDEGPIVVTGTKLPSEDTYYWYVSDGLTSPVSTENTWTISAEDGLSDPVCHCAGMTEAEKLQQ